LACPARAAGKDLTLKLGWRHAVSIHEADALQLGHGVGAVRLHAADRTEHNTALLGER
jgi:hypothetical protein